MTGIIRFTQKNIIYLFWFFFDTVPLRVLDWTTEIVLFPVLYLYVCLSVCVCVHRFDSATFQKIINNKEKKKHYVMHIFEGDPTYTNRKH